MGGGSNAALSDDAERASHARRTLTILPSRRGVLAGIHGRRKSLLLVSEGIDYNVEDPFHNPSATTVNDDLRETLTSAARSDVAIYGIDPRGLIGRQRGRHRVRHPVGDTERRQRSGSVGVDRTNCGCRTTSLRTLSDNTGGFAVLNQNDFEGALRSHRPRTTARTTCSRTIRPPRTRSPGSSIRSRCSVSRPGVTVRARTGYAMPGAKAASADEARAEGRFARDRRRARQPAADDRHYPARLRGAVQGLIRRTPRCSCSPSCRRAT